MVLVSPSIVAKRDTLGEEGRAIPRLKGLKFRERIVSEKVFEVFFDDLSHGNRQK